MEKIIQICTPFSTGCSDVAWGEIIVLTDRGNVFIRERSAANGWKWKKINLPDYAQAGPGCFKPDD